jgi:hypothetical protein
MKDEKTYVGDNLDTVVLPHTDWKEAGIPAKEKKVNFDYSGTKWPAENIPHE